MAGANDGFDRRPSFSQSLLAGALAGTAVDLSLFPIDTIKTRLQTAQGFVKAGGFRGVYRGVGSVLIGSAPGGATFFATYEALKKCLPSSGYLAPLSHMVAASAGEVVSCLVRVPTEVVKTRAQTSTYGPLAQSSFSAARLIFINDGLLGFYRGFGITIMREIPFTSIQFPLYEFFKLQLSRYFQRKPLRAYEAAACGSVAGGIAAALTTPLDVVKTRVMLDLKSSSKGTFPTIPQRIKQIYVSEGLSGLFSGVVPRTIWISAGGAVFLGAYEFAVQGLMGL